MELFLEQQGIGAEIDVLLARRTRPSTILSISGCISGSPPGIETIGVPALIHGFETFLRAQVRFQNVRGILDLAAPSASQVAAEERARASAKWVRLRPLNFCLRT